MPDRNGVTHPKYGTCPTCKQGFEVTVEGLIPPHEVPVVGESGARLVQVDCGGSNKSYAEYLGLRLRATEARYAAESR
jgi:hypothetical protein